MNANADGDTPIAGGVVSVSRCAHPAVGAASPPVPPAPIHRRAGRAHQRGGVALLDFKRLPGCYLVGVSGGQGNGATLHGAFRAEAHNLSGKVMTVLVTPVSTLTYDLLHEHPGMSRGRATRVVQSLLGIPSNFDDIDLAADDMPFDGDTYLAAVFRAGSIDRANQDLLRTAQRHRRHTFRAHNASAADEGDLEQWWNDLDVNKMVRDGLKDLGLSILAKGAEAGGKWVLGRLLDEWGLKDVKDFLLPKSDTQKIIEMIQELTRRVNKLQETSDTILKEVLGTHFNTVVGPALDLIGKVDAIQTRHHGPGEAG